MSDAAASGAPKKHRIDMLNGPLFGKLILFTVPLVLSSVLQLLFNAADIVVIGRFAGTDSLAAVGATTYLINLITNLFIGFSVGANVVMAQAIGAGNTEKAQRVVHTSVLIGLVGGAIALAIGIGFSTPLLRVLNTDADILGKAALYLRIYFVGAPVSMLYNFGAAVLRAKGDTRRPLLFLLLAGALNAGLNVVFVVPLHMDVVGVALATILSQLLSAVLVVICLLREKDECRLHLRKLRFFGAELKEILRMGLPAGIYSTLFSLSNLVVQSGVNGFGKIVTAGNSASANLEGFVWAVSGAVGQAATTFTSQNYGAGDLKRVRRVLLESLLIVSVTVEALALTVMFCGRPLASIYTEDPLVVDVAVIKLRRMMPLAFLQGSSDVLVGSLRGMGRFVFPTVSSLVAVCGSRIVWVWTVFRASHTLETLFLCYPISWFLACVLHVVTFAVVFCRLSRRTARAAAPPLADAAQAEADAEAEEQTGSGCAAGEQTGADAETATDAEEQTGSDAEAAATAERERAPAEEDGASG